MINMISNGCVDQKSVYSAHRLHEINKAKKHIYIHTVGDSIALDEG